jgi:DNA-binding XRE family transcriptional regulator
MTRTLDEMMAALPAARRRAVEARAAELVRDELSLRALRKSLGFTQTEVAKRLRKGQDAVSRIEAREDLLLSTLRDYVSALDGELEIFCRFKDRRAVRLAAIRPSKRRRARASTP